MFLHPVKPVLQQTDGFLFKQLLLQINGVGNALPFIYPFFSFLLLYSQAIIFNQMVNKQRLMQKANYLPAMAYLLITSMFNEWNILSAPLILNSLLIWVWAKMSGLSNIRNVTAHLFNIGIITGIATFFYFPSIAFTALIIVGLVLTRPFKLTEWLVSLLGIITPYYFLLSYLFLTDSWINYKFPEFVVSLPVFFDSRLALASILVILVATIIGLFYIRQNFRRQLVQTRKSWNLVFLYFFVTLCVPFTNTLPTFQYWILCAVPIAAFISCTFLYPAKKWFPLLLHWLMVGFTVLSYFI